MTEVFCWVLNSKSDLGQNEECLLSLVKMGLACYFSTIQRKVFFHAFHFGVILIFFMAQTDFEVISLCFLLGILCIFYRTGFVWCVFLITVVNSFLPRI